MQTMPRPSASFTVSWMPRQIIGSVMLEASRALTVPIDSSWLAPLRMPSGASASLPSRLRAGVEYAEEWPSMLRTTTSRPGSHASSSPRRGSRFSATVSMTRLKQSTGFPGGTCEAY